jgi:hypothetical protein
MKGVIMKEVITTRNYNLLSHYDRLKDIYIHNRTQSAYLKYLNNLFKDGKLNYIISRQLYDAFSRNPNIQSTFCCSGIYPKHLQYDIPDIKDTIHYMKNLPYDIYMHLIKKELLRKIFLFTFENFLNKRKYGIDFNAYYKIPLNSIQFTTEYQNSGKLYRDFFKNSRSEAK